MESIQKTREFIDGSQGLDFEAMPKKELKERKKELRKYMEELKMEISAAKKQKDSIRVTNAKEISKEVMALNEKMDVKFIQGYGKVNKFITIVGIIAIIVLVVVVGFKM